GSVCLSEAVTRNPRGRPAAPDRSVPRTGLFTALYSGGDERGVSKKLLDCVEALLAHEIGHHVRYPGSLVVHARMCLLEKALLPLESYSLTNLFTDLLINDTLRPALEEQLVRVYQAFDRGTRREHDPAFYFYLAVYEERWQREPGSLMGGSHEEFGKAY